MAQSTTIMAFRKRARSLGYTCISIRYIHTDDTGGKVYEVSALEPMDGQKIVFRSYAWELTFRLRKHKK